MVCYGFKGLDDQKVPDTHVCYQCLLEPDEMNILREVNTIVMLRRALKIIMDEGFPNKTSTFTQKLRKELNLAPILQIPNPILCARGRLQRTNSDPGHGHSKEAKIPPVDPWIQE